MREVPVGVYLPTAPPSFSRGIADFMVLPVLQMRKLESIPRIGLDPLRGMLGAHTLAVS